MRITTFTLKSFILLAFLVLSYFSLALADEDEYEKNNMSFKNFIQCEFTRTDAIDYFNNKPFKIAMVNMYSAVHEGDLLIITGAVKFWVVNQYKTLFVAVGVKELFGYTKVSYFLVRKNDFSILGTELMNFPYKERCPWTQYWIDVD